MSHLAFFRPIRNRVKPLFYPTDPGYIVRLVDLTSELLELIDIYI